MTTIIILAIASIAALAIGFAIAKNAGGVADKIFNVIIRRPRASFFKNKSDREVVIACKRVSVYSVLTAIAVFVSAVVGYAVSFAIAYFFAVQAAE